MDGNKIPNNQPGFVSLSAPTLKKRMTSTTKKIWKTRTTVPLPSYSDLVNFAYFAFFLHICIFAYLQVGEQDRGAAYEGGGEGEQGPGDLGGDLQVGIFAKTSTNTNTITNTNKHPVTSELIFRSVNRRRASMAMAKSKKTDTSKTSISVQMKLPRLDFK